ncbi:hypothetical protein [Geoglobus sp.]
MSDLVYIVQGTSLAVISLVTLGYMLSDDARRILNSGVYQAHVLSIALSLSLVFTWISGVYYFMRYDRLGALLMDLSSIIFWVFLIIANLVVLRMLALKGGAKFRLSKEHFDVILYFGVLWLFSYHLPHISYFLLASLSTIASVIVIYFTYLLGKYYRFKEFFIVPLEIFNFYLSILLTSFSLSALLFARLYSHKAYLLFAIIIYLVLLYGVTSLAREMKSLISKL